MARTGRLVLFQEVALRVAVIKIRRGARPGRLLFIQCRELEQRRFGRAQLVHNLHRLLQDPFLASRERRPEQLKHVRWCACEEIQLVCKVIAEVVDVVMRCLLLGSSFTHIDRKSN